MSKPVSPKPLRKVAAICAYSQDDPPLRNPIIGIAVCCAPIRYVGDELGQRMRFGQLKRRDLLSLLSVADEVIE